MKKYLIMKIDNDCDWETPIAICNNWKKWYWKNKDIDYYYRVYKINNQNKEFEMVKDTYDFIENGMAFYYREEKQKNNKKPKIIRKYPNKKREEEIPEEVLSLMNKGEIIYNISKDYERLLQFKIGNRNYYYGEYNDNYYYDYDA